MSSILPFVFSTAVAGFATVVTGHEFISKVRMNQMQKQDAAFLIGGMLISLCVTPLFIRIAASKLPETKNSNQAKWNFKITGLGVSQAAGYASAFFFKLLRPYIGRINTGFSFGFCAAQFGANIYTLYDYMRAGKNE